MSSSPSPLPPDLGGELLAAVSRSFSLTLKALPAALRAPISLAYLLARASDTLADSAEVPYPVRLDALGLFSALLKTGDPAENARIRQKLDGLIRAEFLAHQSLPAEAQLLQRFERCWQILQAMEETSRQLILEVLTHIVEGQRWDLEFFGSQALAKSLPDAHSLQRYTWQVAGCVGVFWTKLCIQLMPDAITLGGGKTQVLEQAAAYGCGLQRINILRDVAADLRLGRLYLPVADAEAAASDPSILQEPWQQEWQLAIDNLAQGRAYLKRLTNRRLRYATSLPLLIGLRTLQALQQSSWQQRLRRVKISRAQVLWLVLRSLWASRSSQAMDQLIGQMTSPTTETPAA
jgi:farnesyl-diphosphate farnesyltransferase